MLILTRKTGEAIIIDGSIKVSVLSIEGNQIRLGIDAPKDISVHREEIHNKILAEKAMI
jgi:carbon storage regulator